MKYFLNLTYSIVITSMIGFPLNGYTDQNWGKGYHLEVSKMNTSWQNTGCYQLESRYKHPHFFTDCKRRGHIYFCEKGKVVKGTAKLFWFSRLKDEMLGIV